MSEEKRTRRTAKATDAPRTSTRAKAREGKKAIVGYYPPEMSDQLQSLAVRNERTMQSMVGEAIDMLFEKNGLPTFNAK